MPPRFAQDDESLKLLLQIGQTYENAIVEFKSMYKGGAQDEIRKDVAAFANTRGGVLLVGVTENETNNDGHKVASGFNPSIQVYRQKALIAQALERHIFPIPQVFISVRKYHHGGQDHRIVAVNVMPSPVAIVCEQNSGGDGKSGTPCLVVPFRNDHGNQFPSAAQAIEMMTATKERRVLILLDELAAASKQLVIASEVLSRTLETQSEADHRCGSTAKSKGGLYLGGGVRQYLVTSSDEPKAEYVRHDARCLVIRGLLGASPEFTIPLGLVREVWAVSEMAIGLVLECTLIVTNSDSGASVMVRSNS